MADAKFPFEECNVACSHSHRISARSQFSHMVV